MPGPGAVVREGAQPDRAAVIELARELVLARRIDVDDEEILGLVRTAANST